MRYCCEYKTKKISHLKRHKANMHEIDAKWRDCNYNDAKFKQESNLKRHIYKNIIFYFYKKYK